MEKKEYIERGALIEKLKSVYCADCDNWNEVKCRACQLDDAMIQIDSAPAADVAEVVHGVWIYHECVSTFDGMTSGYSCSICSFFVDEETYDSESFCNNHCGNCGAKMDGREHED